MPDEIYHAEEITEEQLVGVAEIRLFAKAIVSFFFLCFQHAAYFFGKVAGKYFSSKFYTKFFIEITVEEEYRY